MEPRKPGTGSPGVELLVTTAVTGAQENRGSVAGSDLSIWFFLGLAGAFMGGGGKVRIVKKSELSGIRNTS